MEIYRGLLSTPLKAPLDGGINRELTVPFRCPESGLAQTGTKSNEKSGECPEVCAISRYRNVLEATNRSAGEEDLSTVQRVAKR